MIYHLKYNGAPLQGKIFLSGSKSESNRVLLIRHLSQHNFSINNLSDSDDTKVLNEALLQIDTATEFNVGHAGTSMRFLTALFSITPGERILKGSERMHQRPIAELVEALRSVGAEISYLDKEGCPPLKIKGKALKGGSISMRGDVSSQYLSALLLIAPSFENGLVLNITSEFTSKPYLLMTINMMRHFGVDVQDENEIIKVNKGIYQPKPYSVESDWSSASYWYEAVSFVNNASLEILGLKYRGSMQPDSVVMSIFKELGVDTLPIENGVRIENTGRKKKVKKSMDFTNFPDIAQTISCTYIGIQNPLLLTGLHTLRIKETDRIEALKNELSRLGLIVTINHNDLIIEKYNSISKNVSISTYNDHRMAMSFAGLVFLLGEISIQNPEVVSKSYPKFWEVLSGLGVVIISE